MGLFGQKKELCGSGRVLFVKISLLYVAAAVMLWLTTTRHAGPASGEKLNAAAAAGIPEDGRFKVASFNIHSGKGTDGEVDLNRTAGLLKDVDLAGLNEVAGAWLGTPDQASILGEKLGIPWLYAPTEILWGRPDFGSAVLSRLPVESWVRIPLASKGLQPRRNVVLLQAAHPKGMINVLVTHIAEPEKDAAQLQAVIDLFLALEAPVILIGDLNNNSDNPVLREFLDRPEVETAVHADHLLRGRKLIDWIIFKGLECVGSEVLPPSASDHPVILAEFMWGDAAVASGRPDGRETPAGSGSYAKILRAEDTAAD